MASKMQEPFEGTLCRHCDFGKYTVTADCGDWWCECNDCGALLFCYKPMPHQYEYHEDSHKIKMFSGGYGSAKTSTCAAEMIKLTLSTPNGTSLIGAATLPQLEQTAKKDFMAMLHQSLISSYSIQKNYIDLVNGHRILFRPLDSEGKARSLNLCFVWVEEASEVNFDYITQLQTRLRNHATDKHKMILSTNPDVGHVRSEFLMKADSIIGSDRAYYVPEEDKNPNISVHVAPTHKNIHLPPDYYETTARGKPDWWINRFLHGSFDYAEGSVYPDFMDHVVKPFKIPISWERIGGADFGIQDPTVLVLGAIDPDTGIVYVYDEYFRNKLAVPQHAKSMKEKLDEIGIGRLRFLVGDPSGKKRNINDHRSIFDHYGEYGIWFKEGNNRIDAGIAKVQAYLSLGKLKVFNNCVNTIREHIQYKYKTMQLSNEKNLDEKPIDKDNHTCFIEGTLIETDCGLVPIENVKIGDKVWTRQGYKRVYDSSLTGINKEVYKVSFSNGTSIVATGNHPVYVENKGFLPVDSLRYSDKIKVSEHWGVLKCQQNEEFIKGLPTGGIQSPETSQTQGISSVQEQQTEKKNCIYTDRYGKIILEKYQKGIISTIRIAIQPITGWKTSNWSKRLITYLSTENKIKLIMSTLNESDHSQKFGISPSKAKSGTEITPKTLYLNNLKKLSLKYVNTVIVLLRQLTTKQSFVPTLVNPLGDVNKVLMTLQESVLYAEKNSQEINTQKQKHVPESVQVVSVVKQETRHNVYNISVEDAHEYYANGVLVSNCDSLRYMINDLPDDPSLLMTKGKQPKVILANGQEVDNNLPFALQEDPMQAYSGRASWMNY